MKLIICSNRFKQMIEIVKIQRTEHPIPLGFSPFTQCCSSKSRLSSGFPKLKHLYNVICDWHPGLGGGRSNLSFRCWQNLSTVSLLRRKPRRRTAWPMQWWGSEEMLFAVQRWIKVILMEKILYQISLVNG